MMTIFHRIGIACVIVLLCFAGIRARVYASTPDQAARQLAANKGQISPLTFEGQNLLGGTVLTIKALKPLEIGDRPVIEVHLATANGTPVVGQTVRILVDGIRKAEGKTDSAGTAVIPLRYKFSSGSYTVKAIFFGSALLGLDSSSTTEKMVVKPAEAVIRTVPPLAGINFKFNGRLYTSDEDGVIHINIDESGNYPLEVLQVEDEDMPPNVLIEFAGWSDNHFTPNREAHFPRERVLEAGFILSYRVGQVFFDTAGKLIDPDRVSSLTIKGYGHTYTFDNADPHWLPSNHLSRRTEQQYESQEILYYFRSVIIDGANVINQSEQRFHIHPNDILPINVLLYSVQFSSRDAMFGFPIGSGVQLEFPDGHHEIFPFDQHTQIEIPALARGSYKATVVDAGGSTPPTPIHLSRDLDVGLLVVSYIDMLVIFGIPFIIALSLLFIGRPHLVPIILRAPSTFRDFARRNYLQRISSKS